MLIKVMEGNGGGAKVGVDVGVGTIYRYRRFSFALRPLKSGWGVYTFLWLACNVSQYFLRISSEICIRLDSRSRSVNVSPFAGAPRGLLSDAVTK